MIKKQLTLIRHAKSSWEFDVIDHERPLKKRGIDDAHLVASALKIKPDCIKISDATRTKQTANIIIPKLDVKNTPIHFLHELYDFSGELLLHEIKNTSSSVNHLLIFGHNHAITNFVNTYGDLSIDNVPTCGAVTIVFQIEDWSQLKQGQTLQTIYPRDLK